MSQYNPENYPPVEDEPTRENPRLAEELREMVAKDRAWESYKGYGEEYKRENAERAKKGVIQSYEWDKLTFIAQIKVDERGNAVDGHDRDPEAQSHRDVEVEWQKYLSETENDPDSRMVLVEGDPSGYPHPKGDVDVEASSRERAIVERADTGLAMWLAAGEGVDIGRTEPDRAEITEHMLESGCSREEVAAYNFLTNLTESLDQLGDQDLAMHVYGSLALDQIEGFKELSDDEKRVAMDSGSVPALEAQAREYALKKLNPILGAWGVTQFSLDNQGRLRLPEMTTADVWGKLQQGEPGKISADNINFRDRRIFESITSQVAKGKKPFVVYGGSHVVALKPALDAYFGQEAAVHGPESELESDRPPGSEISARLAELDPWIEAADTLSQSRVMRNFLGMLMNSPDAPAQAQTINEALARLKQGVVDKRSLDAHVQAGTLPEGGSDSYEQMANRINESVQVALKTLQASLESLKQSPSYGRVADELEGQVVGQMMSARRQ